MSYENVGSGWAFVYRVRCTCGLRGAAHPTKKQAIAARDEHRAAVAPPADSRCRDTQAHRTCWWDACQLCQYQDTLPGFEEIA